jgi:hypothetical protein
MSSGRARLGWLAARAAVPLMVIHDIESERRVPATADLKAIRRAIHDGGMRLLHFKTTARVREAIKVRRLPR